MLKTNSIILESTQSRSLAFEQGTINAATMEESLINSCGFVSFVAWGFFVGFVCYG